MGNKHVIGFIIGMTMFALGLAYELWGVAMFGLFLVLQVQIHLFYIEPIEQSTSKPQSDEGEKHE